jgi:hypothetical protein
MVLLIIAIVFYPGGNIMDNTATSYSFFWNAMCDLGADFSFNGEFNRVSQYLFKGAISLYAAILIIFFSTLWLFFRDKKSTKLLSSIASSCIFFSAIFYIGIISTIGKMPIHMIMSSFAPLLEFTAIILYTIAIFIDSSFPALSKYVFLTMSTVAVIYMFFAITGAIFKGNYNWLVQRLGHNIFHFLMFTFYLIQGIGAYLFVRSLKTEYLDTS